MLALWPGGQAPSAGSPSLWLTRACSPQASLHFCLSSLGYLEAVLFLPLIFPFPPPGSCFNLSVAEMQSTQRAYFYRRFPILHLESGDWLPACTGVSCVAYPGLCTFCTFLSFFPYPMAPPAWLCLFSVSHSSCPQYVWHRPPLESHASEGLSWDVGSFTYRENHEKQKLASLELPLEAVSSASTAVCLARGSGAVCV